jgi:hypothetical protein
VRGLDPLPLDIRPQTAQNVLLNPSGILGGAAQPALTVALGRIGFDAQPQQQPQQQPAQVQSAPQPTARPNWR